LRGVVKEQRGPGHVRFRDVPDPHPADGQVTVEVVFSGVCGSDIHIVHDAIALRLRPPVVMGHEFVGRIVEIGPGVSGWNVGDRIVSESAFSVCGTCQMCRTGHDNACADREIIGFAHNGAFADYLLLPSVRLHRPADSLSDEELAVAEPVAGCVHAVIEQCGVQPGDVVVVVGPGTVGLINMQVAKVCGATTVLCGRSRHRLEMGKRLGADYIVDLSSEDPSAIVNGLTAGAGCDVFIECAGTAESVELGLMLLRRRGRYLQEGLITAPACIQFDQIAYKELTVVGRIGQKWSAWELALQFMAEQKVEVAPLISDILPFSRFEEAFGLVESRSRQKVVMHPG
jgi:L-iditol 2-dehydrogenase